MSDILERLRAVHTDRWGCDFDAIDLDPTLRQNEDWDQAVAARDAFAEIERLRAQVADLTKPLVSYQQCSKHQGQSWSVTMIATTVGHYWPKTVCPNCEQEARHAVPTDSQRVKP